ncbi:protein Hook homolog 3-like isoform X2 [Gigantopelta aegis]|uniref:protein Hook homolog 3-like isoform X2 n=1 Tax=Gigantopelta aegis TaxID=1735272 RepID=UPI001B888D12|nr:protein Hook homolog 3-like isoform X2 [Gigantopelta aegis]
MDRDKLCDSLITWLNTFNINVPCQTTEDLSDGQAMAQVLQQIAPDYFDEAWRSKIKDDVTNWRVKVSNLKKILQGILEYNVDVLGIHIQDFLMPDINAIGEHENPAELGRLLQLILGCAVNCEEKQEYIQRIMAMEESVQQMIMKAIQELMTKEMPSVTDADSELNEQLKKTVEELNSALETKDELLQRCHELDMQVASLSEERTTLSIENERMAERLHQMECTDDPSTPAGKRYHQLQQQIEKLQEEVYKLEAGKDDYRIKYEVLFKEHADLKNKNSELTSLAEESRSLKDELDVLKHTSEQVAKYESVIESYKKKLEDMSILRAQMKLLEEKNTKYMQETIELQEEARKVSSLKQQLEVYKIQAHELQNKVADEIKRADKAEFELKRGQEKMGALVREKERIGAERDSLVEMNEELKCTQLQNVPGIGVGGSDAHLAVNDMLTAPPELKEKLLRLEHENKMLKMGTLGDHDKQTEGLQSLLDDATGRKNELETEVRIGNQRILELEAQLEDLHNSKLSSVSDTQVSELHTNIRELMSKVSERDSQIDRQRQQVEELEKQVGAEARRREHLQDELRRKDEQMACMEEKYKKYCDKARQVILGLQSSQGNTPEVEMLRKQLIEKDNYIEHLQRDHDKAKAIRDQEEKCMVSAWYNLGMKMHRQAAEERLAKKGSVGQSFLARQRQVHTRPGQVHTRPGQPLVTVSPNSTNVSLSNSSSIGS